MAIEPAEIGISARSFKMLRSSANAQVLRNRKKTYKIGGAANFLVNCPRRAICQRGNDPLQCEEGLVDVNGFSETVTCPTGRCLGSEVYLRCTHKQLNFTGFQPTETAVPGGLISGREDHPCTHPPPASPVPPTSPAPPVAAESLTRSLPARSTKYNFACVAS